MATLYFEGPTELAYGYSPTDIFRANIFTFSDEAEVKSLYYYEDRILLYFEEKVSRKLDSLTVTILPTYMILEKEGNQALGEQEVKIYVENSSEADAVAAEVVEEQASESESAEVIPCDP